MLFITRHRVVVKELICFEFGFFEPYIYDLVPDFDSDAWRTLPSH